MLVPIAVHPAMRIKMGIRCKSGTFPEAVISIKLLVSFCHCSNKREGAKSGVSQKTCLYHELLMLSG
jgi:hypothetical protein